ncbi:MAG: aryl-sulfate sulfotransferase [Bacteroidales bacterium]|nr:aryl-sulfate sulfotransferase [Bacteroidales bacterium]
MNKILCFMMFAGAIFSGCSQEKLQFISAPEITKNPNESVVLAGILKFQTNKPVAAKIFLDCEDHSFTLSYDSTYNPSRGLPIIGMKPGRSYRVKLLLQSAGEKLDYRKKMIFTSPELPSDPIEFPGFKVTTLEEDQTEPGITLLNPRRRGLDQARLNVNFGMLVAIDETGEVIWYYRTDSRISDFNFLPNGHIAYMTQDFRLVEIDLLGNVINSWYAADRPYDPPLKGTPVRALTFHHDAFPMENGNYLMLGSEYKTIENYYTSETEEFAPRKTQNVMGDVIYEFNPEGEIVWDWHAFDHLDPMRIGYETFSGYWNRRGFRDIIDWSHANTVLYDPDDNTIIVNFRYLSSILKIDRNTKDIKWIFGEPTGYAYNLRSKLIDLDKGDWFWHQHSPSLSPDGTLFIFNNDNYKARPFDKISETTLSYAAAYKINEEDLSAELLWTSRITGETGLASFAMGDVDWLEKTNNILVSYGALRPSKEFGYERSWSMIREYTYTTPARVVWEMHIASRDKNVGQSVGWTIFSAERLDNFINTELGHE